MKVAFITAQTPYGKKEHFILPEIIEFVNYGNEALVLPLRPDSEIFEGEEPQIVSQYTIPIPLYSKGVILLSFVLFLKSPIKSLRLIGKIILKSGNPKKVMKNLLIFGKGLVLGEVVRRHKIEHIHAHWAGTTSTAAYIAAYFSNIPWSLTCHRWDIAENNMLKEKVRNAKFVRIINDNGYDEVNKITNGQSVNKCYKLHVGINIKPDVEKVRKAKEIFTIAVPANLVEVKGHIYLIEAINMLVKNNHKVMCNFYGCGELEEFLKTRVNELKLNDLILFKPMLAHDKLLSKYGNGDIDCVILPSITTKTEKEGIPVSLMEAMAYKIPVISTNTGGIPELLHDGAGIMVNQKNPDELSDSILKLMEGNEFYNATAEKGYKRVYEEFYLADIMKKIIELMEE